MTTPDSNADYRVSSFREKLLEHVFVSELLQEAWLGHDQTVEVLRSEVDASGYDLVLECNGVVRHVQLKSSWAGARTKRQNVNVKLAEKPCGCVVWLVFEKDNTRAGRLKLDYLFFGEGPREPLCSDETLRTLKVAKHAKGDATGYKAEKPGIRVVPKSAFTRIDSTRELLERLFGPLPAAE